MKKSICSIAILALFLLASFTVHAKKERFFLDEKSQVIGIATVGHYSTGDLYEKFVVSPVDSRIHMTLAPRDTIFPSEAEMTNYLRDKNAGRIVLDELLIFDGETLNDAELRHRAELNNIRSDHERASLDILGAENVLRDDINPILTNNYLFVRLEYTKPYINEKGEEKASRHYRDYLYKVVVDDDIIRQIYDAWEDPEAYRRIRIPLEYMETPKAEDSSLGSLTTALEKEHVEFKHYGQMMSYNSFDLGDRTGVKKGDNVSIYRQVEDRHGNMYSKRIARGKVNGFDNNGRYAHFFRVSGTRGNMKNGDLVNVSRSSNFSFGGQAVFTEKTWAVDLMGDYSFGFAKSGFYSHMLIKLGYAQTMQPGRIFNYDGVPYKSPHFFNIGVGYGFGKTMLGFLDLMPFVMAEFDDGEMSEAKASSGDTDDDNKKKLRGYFIRVPIGVRLNINIVYPLRLSVEAGYALHYGLGLIKETAVLKDALRDIGANRGGFFVAAGLLF